jgi:hypothetical protein
VTSTDKFAHRLALLKDVDLSEEDLGSMAAELEDLDRIVAELDEFAQSTVWVSQQVQSASSKV